jgi:hypothetical protein
VPFQGAGAILVLRRQRALYGSNFSIGNVLHLTVQRPIRIGDHRRRAEMVGQNPVQRVALTLDRAHGNLRHADRIVLLHRHVHGLVVVPPGVVGHHLVDDALDQVGRFTLHERLNKYANKRS